MVLSRWFDLSLGTAFPRIGIDPFLVLGFPPLDLFVRYGEDVIDEPIEGFAFG